MYIYSEVLVMLAVSEGEDGAPTFFGLVILIEEPDEEDCVQEVGEDEVPEGVVIGDHREPEEEADHAGPSEAVEVLTCEALRVSVLS